MTSFKDFDAIHSEQEPACEFQLGGRTWHTKSQDDVPWPLVKRFFQAQASGDVSKMMVHIDDFFTAVLQKDEVEDFMKLEDDGDIMTFQVFSALIEFIAEEVFGSPTGPSGTSPAGRRPIKSGSRASSRSRAKVPQTT